MWKLIENSVRWLFSSTGTAKRQQINDSIQAAWHYLTTRKHRHHWHKQWYNNGRKAHLMCHHCEAVRPLLQVDFRDS